MICVWSVCIGPFVWRVLLEGTIESIAFGYVTAAVNTGVVVDVFVVERKMLYI